MAYDKNELEAQAMKAIKDNNLFFINDLTAYLPCSRQTFYTLGLDKLDTIKGALEENKIKTKNGLRSKWYKSNNATVQIALMKLIADDDERKKISQNYTDLTSDGKALPTPIMGGTSVHSDNSVPQDSQS